MLSACDVWVVGTGDSAPATLAEHWTGGSNWARVATPSPGSYSRLNSVAAISASSLWAVGDYGLAGSPDFASLIERWDGTSWTQVPSHSPGVDSILYGVSALTASDAWAVGYTKNVNPDGTHINDSVLIEHWDGTNWTPDTQAPSPDNSYLVGISAASATDIYAVGDTVRVNPDGTTSTTALIEHWDGTRWSVVTLSPPGSYSDLISVKVVSTTNIWAVGVYRPDSSSGTSTLIEHWDGTNWSRVASPNPGPQKQNLLFGVTASSATSAWAVGSSAGNPLLLHWDGSSWVQAATPDAAAGDYLRAVQAAPDGGTWMVGGGQSAFAAPVLGAPRAQIVVNVLGSNLRETGLGNGPAGNLSVAAGTGPAVAVSPAGDFKVAWTAANDHLWTIDQAGHRTDTMRLVLAGTSPAITALRGGGYEIAFTGAADGQLWITGPDGVFTVAPGAVAVAPGTSPAIAASPAGGLEIAVHAAGSDDLTIIGPNGIARDTGQQMAAGTSPALAALATGGFEAVYVGAAGGQVRDIGPDGVVMVPGGGVTAAAGTSPAIAASPDGLFAIAVHASGSNDLWIIRSANNSGNYTGNKIAASTSPAIAAAPIDYQVAYQATGTGNLTTFVPGLTVDTAIPVTAATGPAIAVPATFSTTARTPYLRGLDQSSAENLITAVGLAVGQISFDSHCIDVAGGVLTQTPLSGATVPLGTTVNMTVSSGNDANGNPCIFQ